MQSLTEEEKLAAAAVLKVIKSDSINLDILKYLIAGHPVGSVHFCRQVGIHTATMSARVRAIESAAKRGDRESIQDRLIQILGVKTVSRGGHEKT